MLIVNYKFLESKFESAKKIAIVGVRYFLRLNVWGLKQTNMFTLLRLSIF